MTTRHGQTSFGQAILPLLLAPLGPMTIASWLVIHEGSRDAAIWIYFFTALTCYVIEMLFVVPFLIWQPWLRQPSIWVGGLWGVLAVWASVGVLNLLPPAPNGNHVWLGWGAVVFFSVCGLLSGAVFAVASRLLNAPRRGFHSSGSP